MKTNKLIAAWIYLVTKRPLLVVLLTLSIVLPMAKVGLNLDFNNKLDFYFEEDDEKLKVFKDFVKEFNVHETLVMSIEFGDVLTPENIQILRDTTERLSDKKYVASVTSLTNFRSVRLVGDEVTMRPVIPNQDHYTFDELKRIRQELLDDEMVRDKLFLKNGKYSNIVVEIKKFENDDLKRAALKDLTSTVKSVLEPHRLPSLSAGVPLIESEIEHIVGEDNEVFRFLIVLVIGFVSFFAIRDLWLTFLLMVNISLVGAFTMGLLYITGESLNTVTVIITPTLLAIAVMDGIHVVSHILQLRNESDAPLKNIVGQTISDLAFPCFMTFITTVLGYLANLATNVRPTKIVGIYSSLGLSLGYVLTLVFLPSMILLTYRSVKKQRDFFARFDRYLDFLPSLESIALWVIHHRKIVSIFTVLTLSVLIGGIFKIRAETDFTTYLKDDNQVKQDLLAFQQKAGAQAPFEMVLQIKPGASGTFRDSENLNKLNQIQSKVMERYQGTEITSVWSIAEYLRILSKSFHNKDQLPEDSNKIAELMEISDQKILDRIMTVDARKARITFYGRFFNSSSKEGFQALIDQELLRDYPEFNIELTGMPMLYNWLGSSIVSGEIQAFLVALVMISLCMYSMCKTLRLTLISLVPNVVPILAVFGLMGWLDIPLEASTSMIANIVFGLVVDDTIHYLHWYNHFKKKGENTQNALIHSFKHTGRAAFFSCVILAGGFSVLMAGSTLPTYYFGLLATLSVIVALSGDLFILPMVLLAFDRDKKPVLVQATKDNSAQGHFLSLSDGAEPHKTAKISQ
jgi:predicted RND superfamily exporter protein